MDINAALRTISAYLRTRNGALLIGNTEWGATYISFDNGIEEVRTADINQYDEVPEYDKMIYFMWLAFNSVVKSQGGLYYYGMDGEFKQLGMNEFFLDYIYFGI